MRGWLFDENLPLVPSLRTRLPLTHASDLGSRPTDSQLWAHAQQNDLAIVTKDADFSQRIVLGMAPPRVVHLRVGNERSRFRCVAEKRLAPDRIHDRYAQARERVSGSPRSCDVGTDSQPFGVRLRCLRLLLFNLFHLLLQVPIFWKGFLRFEFDGAGELYFINAR
jgi:predicted nuclease of predicted toxin-antitoxin system